MNFIKDDTLGCYKNDSEQTIKKDSFFCEKSNSVETIKKETPSHKQITKLNVSKESINSQSDQLQSSLTKSKMKKLNFTKSISKTAKFNYFNFSERVLVSKTLENVLKVDNDSFKFKYKIFLMDDDVFNLDIQGVHIKRFQRESSGLGIEINYQMSSNYDEGLKKIKKGIELGGFTYDIVITDYNLDMSKTGLDFIKEIKTIYAENRLIMPYFLLVSGEVEYQDDHVKNHFYTSISKPINFAIIKKSLLDIFEVFKNEKIDNGDMNV